MRLIAAGGRSNDSCLHARQFLEQSLGSGRGSPLTGADYQQAASLLDGKGKTQLGAAMDALASVSWELQAATARVAQPVRRQAADPARADRRGPDPQRGRRGERPCGAGHRRRALLPRVLPALGQARRS